MAEIFVPILHSFENGNVFTGSHGVLRYRIEPQLTKINKKEVDLASSTLRCEIWYGEKCYELSEMAAERTCPLTGEGRAEIKTWLESNIK